MGQEAVCRVRYRREVSEGRALLETDELIFRGDFRLKIPLTEIQSAKATNGELRVKSADGTAIFELGPQSKKWLLRILTPPSRLKKLGVKTTSTVGVVCIRDESFTRELAACAATIWQSKPKKNTDIIFLAAESLHALKRLVRLQKFIKPNGAIWVVYPKGQKHITERDVMTAGKSSELVDVKVARFSPTHTALKMVIPLRKRKAGPEEI